MFRICAPVYLTTFYFILKSTHPCHITRCYVCIRQWTILVRRKM